MLSASVRTRLRMLMGGTRATELCDAVDDAQNEEGGSGDFLSDGSVPMAGDLDMDGNDILDVRNINTLGTDLDVLVTGGNDIWLTSQNGESYTTFQVGDKYVEISSGSNLITANGTTNKISLETTELMIIAPEAEVPDAQFYMHTANEQAYLWLAGTFAEFGSDGTAETYITSGTGGILLNSDDRVDASASVGPLCLPNTSVHASPQNGDIWYDTGSNQLKARVNGATVTITTS